MLDLKQLVLDSLEDLKGVDITFINVQGKTEIADYMVFVSGTSTRHVKALVANVVSDAHKRDIIPIGVEGQQTGEWVLIDLNDVVVHVMLPAVREFYDIESLWDHTTLSQAERAFIEH